MTKGAKIWLIIAASLILMGCIIFGGIMAILKWDLTKLSTNKYQTSNYEINENYRNISIVTNTADIAFVISENSRSTVECYEQKNVKHSVTVKDDTLVIETVDTRKWYDHIGITLETPKLTLYLPQAAYASLVIEESTGDIEIQKDFKFESIDVSASTGDIEVSASASEFIKISTDTGDINVDGVSTGAMTLSVTTGKVTASDIICEGDVSVSVSTGKAYLTNISCKNVISSGNTGDFSLKNVIASEIFSIERSTGDVKFDACDATEIFVETDTGDVIGTLLSEKVFITKTDTGDIDVPNSIIGGRCEITTDTGNIKISIN